MLNLRKKTSLEDLLHDLLPKLLTKRAPASIPLTGEAAQSNDYYCIYFGNKYLVESYNPSTRLLTVFSPDINSTSKIALSDALQYPLSVKYYYKTYWENYTDAHRLARDHKTHWIQIEVHIRIFWNKVSQWLFNKKPLWVIRDRIGLLEFIIERHLGSDAAANNTNSAFSAFQLMTEISSSKWIYHPHSSKARRRLELLLDSFIISGDLKKEGINYVLAPRAIQTLDAYQESERRHRDAITTQWITVWLTLVIAGTAIAELIHAYNCDN